LDKYPVSCFHLGEYFQVDGKLLQQQYKEHISDYSSWEQREHASEWMVFSDNVGARLSIDETALSNGELYTLVTNKASRGRKKALVAMIQGTQADRIAEVLEKIPERVRNQVEEVTMDMAPSMISSVRRCFPNANQVIDRFHVQKLAHDAVQEIRIKYRWLVIDQETSYYTLAKANDKIYTPELLSNGDTLKQLLARSRYLLFKHHSKWSQSQKHRAEILFERFPEIKDAYYLSIKLGDIFKNAKVKEVAFKRMALWYNEVEAAGIESFRTVSRSIQTHYINILNFFNNRSTNASAESFNAKIKAFRATSRGVRDINFFLFRVANIYA
jgi:transposase